MKGCFVCKKGGRLLYTFGGGRYERVCENVEMCTDIINEQNFAEHRVFLREVEVIFCTWDMVLFTREQIHDIFPNLKVVFYAAASVRYFAQPFLEEGVRVISAWRAMAVPVAEFTVAMITLANKGAFFAMNSYKMGDYQNGNALVRDVYPGTYDIKIGILGAGAIGGLVVELLKGRHCDIMVYDPFLSQDTMGSLGIERTYSLSEIFSQCQTISNHLANNEQTVNMLGYDLFSKMLPTAAFINTGRGAQVVEADLIRALKEEPKRAAYLDVTHPEPVSSDSEFLTLPNVFLTPHIAGFAANEVHILADCMIEQLGRYLHGEAITCEVSLEMLCTMA